MFNTTILLSGCSAKYRPRPNMVPAAYVRVHRYDWEVCLCGRACPKAFREYITNMIASYCIWVYATLLSNGMNFKKLNMNIFIWSLVSWDSKGWVLLFRCHDKKPSPLFWCQSQSWWFLQLLLFLSSIQRGVFQICFQFPALNRWAKSWRVYTLNIHQFSKKHLNGPELPILSQRLCDCCDTLCGANFSLRILSCRVAHAKANILGDRHQSALLGERLSPAIHSSSQERLAN